VLALLVRSRPAGADGLGAAGDLEFDVLVLARSPRAGAKRALRPSLGEEGCRALQEWLVARAASWGQQVAPGRARVAFSEPGADGLELPDRVLRVDQPGGGLGERLAELVERGGAGGGVADRPLLIVGTDLPSLSNAHAAAAVADLGDGCDVSFGPASDGGCYLLGLRAPDPELLGRLVGAWRRTEIMERAAAGAVEAGLAFGLLRSERELHAPGDARALLADPTTPGELVELLGPAGGRG